MHYLLLWKVLCTKVDGARASKYNIANRQLHNHYLYYILNLLMNARLVHITAQMFRQATRVLSMQMYSSSLVLHLLLSWIAKEVQYNACTPVWGSLRSIVYLIWQAALHKSPDTYACRANELIISCDYHLG